MNCILKSRALGRQSLSAILMSLLVSMLPACHAQPSKSDTTGTSAAERSQVKAPIGTRIELTLVGYNYTNRYIDQFDVNGQGGGNIHVSGPGTAGSGSICCVSYRSGAKARKVKIRWQAADACTYHERTSGGEKFSDTHSYFKEMEVQVDPNIPDFPRYFEVHIYPDGHAEAAVTAHASRARLALSKDREDNSDYPRCPNGKKPKEGVSAATDSADSKQRHRTQTDNSKEA
jgi:hypothetical protein